MVGRESRPVRERAAEAMAAEVAALRREQGEVLRHTDIALKQIDATAHAEEGKHREINEEAVRTAAVRRELVDMEDAISARRAEEKEVKKERKST